MKLFTILAMFLLISSCSINTGVIGKFSSNKGSNIELRNDSTFIYEYRAFHLYQYSVGKWKMLNKNLIVLTSEIKSIVVPITVKNVVNQLNVNVLSLDLKIDSMLEESFREKVETEEYKVAAIIIDVTVKEGGISYDAIEIRFFEPNNQERKEYIKYNTHSNYIEFI